MGPEQSFVTVCLWVFLFSACPGFHRTVPLTLNHADLRWDTVQPLEKSFNWLLCHGLPLILRSFLLFRLNSSHSLALFLPVAWQYSQAQLCAARLCAGHQYSSASPFLLVSNIFYLLIEVSPLSQAPQGCLILPSASFFMSCLCCFEASLDSALFCSLPLTLFRPFNLTQVALPNRFASYPFLISQPLFISCH